MPPHTGVAFVLNANQKFLFEYIWITEVSMKHTAYTFIAIL